MTAETGRQSFNGISRRAVHVLPVELARASYDAAQCAVAVTASDESVAMYGYVAEKGRLVLERHAAVLPSEVPVLSDAPARCPDVSCRVVVDTASRTRAYIVGGARSPQPDCQADWMARVEFGIGLEALKDGGGWATGDWYTHDEHTIQQVMKELTARGHRIAHPILRSYVQTRYCA